MMGDREPCGAALVRCTWAQTGEPLIRNNEVKCALTQCPPGTSPCPPPVSQRKMRAGAMWWQIQGGLCSNAVHSRELKASYMACKDDKINIVSSFHGIQCSRNNE